MKATTEMVNEMLRDDGTKIIDTLISKNTHYDNSAMNPFNVFAKGNAFDKIKVRIDDKLARLSNAFQADVQPNDISAIFGNEDTIQDLIGYLLLLRCAARLASQARYAEEEERENTYLVAKSVDPYGERIANIEEAVERLTKVVLLQSEFKPTIGVESAQVVVDRKTKQPRPRRKPGPAKKLSRRKK